MELLTKIKTPLAEVTYDAKKNYLYVIFLHENVRSIEQTLTHLQQLKALIGDSPPPLFFADIRQAKHVSKEVRDMLGNHPLAIQVASHTAVLINSSLSKILGNLFIRFSKPPYPTKLFTEENKAIEWLFNQR